MPRSSAPSRPRLGDKEEPDHAGSSLTPGTNIFILNPSTGAIDSGTRKAIRSHVMRGKNKRKQDQRRPDTLAGRSSKVESGEPEPWVLASPRAVASELSLFGYAEDLKPYMLKLFHQGMAFIPPLKISGWMNLLIRAPALTVVKPSTYTAEMALVEGSESNMFCLYDVPQNPLLLNAMLFTSQAFGDVAQGLPFGVIAQHHLALALHHLQIAISDSQRSTDNATLIAVTSLATTAAILGDVEAAQKHLEGLHRMVQLRGGLQTLEKGGMVKHKAQRIDIGVAMATGAALRFVNDVPISWDTQLAHGVETVGLTELIDLFPRPDPRLLNIWADLRFFCREANEATKTGVKMSAAFFNRMTSTVPRRLFALGGEYEATSLSELLRLSMLAFTKSVLVQIKGLGERLKVLADGLSNAVQAQATQATTRACDLEKLHLWVLFISTLAIFESLHDHEWLRAALLQSVSSLGLRAWPEIRSTLKGFLWIDMLYNQPGKQLFESWLDIKETTQLGTELDNGD